MSWLTSWWRKDEKKDNQEERTKLEDTWTGLQDIKEYTEGGYQVVENVYGTCNFNSNTVMLPLNYSMSNDTQNSSGKYFWYLLVYYNNNSNFNRYKITMPRIGINQNATFYTVKRDSEYLYSVNKIFSAKYGTPGLYQQREMTNHQFNLKVYIKGYTPRAFAGLFDNINHTIRLDSEVKDYYTNVDHETAIPDPVITNKLVIQTVSSTSSKYKGYSVNLVGSGNIPLWVYETILPIKDDNKWVKDPTEGGQILTDINPSNYSGKIYRINSINDTWYDNRITVDSAINLKDMYDIDFEKFKENFYVQNVDISIYYKDRIESEHPFHYWDKGVLKESRINYDDKEQRNIKSIEVDPNDQSTIIFHFNKQITNIFLNNFLYNSTLQIVLLPAPELNNQFKSIMESGVTINKLVIKVDEFVLKKTTNEFDLSFTGRTANTVKIVYDEGTFEKTVGTDITLNYAIGELYCINTTTMPVTLYIRDQLSEISFTNYIPYDHLYLTNVKGSTTYPATTINYITEGDASTYYKDYIPIIVNTINAPPAPGETVTQEIYMDLIDISSSFLPEKFGTIENGVYISQKIYPNKVTLSYYNYGKLVNLNMMSSKKLGNGEYKKTIICTVVPENAVSSENVTFPSNDTVRLTFDTTEPDLFGDQSSPNIKITQYVNGKKFADNIKEKLELYIDTMIIKDNEKNVEFTTYTSDLNQVSVYYTINGTDYGVKIYEWNSSKTRVGTLYMVSTENEQIKPITYSFESNRVLISEMNYKVSRVNTIDVANVTNTLLSGLGINKTNIILVNNGSISKTFYEKVMPITGKKIGHMMTGSTNYGYINYKGDNSGEDLVGINTSFEEEYLPNKSSMNLISITNPDDIDTNKFGDIVNDVFKQNVFLSEIIAFRDDEIKDKFDNAHLMSKNEQVITGGLGDGEMNYAPTQVRYGNPNLVYNIYNNNSKIQLELNNQNNNNFLITVIENGKNYTDVYLNRDLTNRENDMSYKFRNLTKYDTLVLNMKAMRLCNKNVITFNFDDENETSIDMGNIRVHYYINDTTETYSVWPSSGTTIISEYKVYSVYMIYGNITNDKLEPLDANETGNEIFKKEQESGVTTISINLQEQEITRKVVVNEIYNTNCLIKNVNDLPIYTNIVVKGDIPQWVFKEILPLPTKMSSNGIISNDESTIQLVSINYLPCDFEDLEIGIHLSDNDDVCKIDLSNVANESAFDRMYSGEGEYRKKAFFVNKVTLLERFKGKIDGVFKYYEGTTLKDCVYNEEDPSSSDITYVDDWALKLPECYEGCEVSGTELTVKFGEYLQIGNGYDNHLFEKLCKSERYYLDLSMKMNSNLNLDNITTLNIYLDILKYISDSVYVALARSKEIWVIYNKDGFLKNKVIEINNVKQEIDYCYLIHETNISKIDTKNILIKPASDVFSSKNNIILHDYLTKNIRMTINNLKCTNIFQHMDLVTIIGKFPPKTEVNLLVSGSIPKWLNEYFYNENKALPIRVESGSNGTCKLAEPDGGTEVSADYFMITSINDTPAPGIGIDNSDPKDQCSLNLEDFMPEQPDSGGTDPSGNDSNGGDSTNNG